MNSMMIGPGHGCRRCGEYYGHHLKGCPVPTEQKRKDTIAAKKLGERVLAAIKAKDALALGRLLQEIPDAQA